MRAYLLYFIAHLFMALMISGAIFNTSTHVMAQSWGSVLGVDDDAVQMTGDFALFELYFQKYRL